MTLVEAFAKSNGRKAKVNGTTVHSFHRIDVGDGDLLTILRRSASRVRAQALKVAADRADLRANGIVVPTVSIWSHTAPTTVELDVVGRRARHVDIWNSWSFEGVDSAWLGNAGMMVETEGDRTVLRCSDGLGAADFDDLVVEITHNRA